MDDEAQRRDEIARAHQAKTVLDNPLFREAREQIRAGLLRIIETADVSDVQTIKDCQRALKIQTKYEQALRHFMQTGDMAVKQIIDLEERRGGLVDRFRRNQGKGTDWPSA